MSEHQQPPQQGGHQFPPPPWATPPAAPGGAEGAPPAAPTDDPAADLAEAVQESLAPDGPRVEERTRRQKAHGLDKCPRCGSSEIAYDIASRALVCSYCRDTFNEPNAQETFGFTAPILELRGTTIGAGSEDIVEDSGVLTMKCQGCGAEVVIRTDETLQARCHWCRQTLSVATQVPNGAVPDAVLPFTITREQAMEKVREFVGARRTFADRRFLAEFTPENVFGVFMPYLMVDANIHAELVGTGEDTVRTYTERVGSGDNAETRTYHDVDVYQVGRKFDLLVDDLATQSSTRYHRDNNTMSTNYVLRAIQPFDTEDALVYNPGYLTGFSSEKRDLDIGDIDQEVVDKFLSIARARALPTLGRYDRGVRWEGEGVGIRGTRWVAVLLPVWLYSQYDGQLSHYVAVNGRTGQTMGSIPISQPRAIGASCAVAAVVTALSVAITVGALFF
ncbi:TFIIB-type zinc ribbon-containing protein [Brachybacterium hainanense]|uniref:TFIIB-type zinc ribbon-containing protein n=1 Tax=Brachybacterium hainanense TaxID=1541174 RepID=A0ABV6REB6_9MICO